MIFHIFSIPFLPWVFRWRLFKVLRKKKMKSTVWESRGVDSEGRVAPGRGVNAARCRLHYAGHTLSDLLPKAAEARIEASLEAAKQRNGQALGLLVQRLGRVHRRGHRLLTEHCLPGLKCSAHHLFVFVRWRGHDNEVQLLVREQRIAALPYGHFGSVLQKGVFHEFLRLLPARFYLDNPAQSQAPMLKDVVEMNASCSAQTEQRDAQFTVAHADTPGSLEYLSRNEHENNTTATKLSVQFLRSG